MPCVVSPSTSPPRLSAGDAGTRYIIPIPTFGSSFFFFSIGIGNGTCSVSPFHSHCEKKVLFSCGGASSVLPCCTPTPTRLRPHCKKNLPGFLFYRFPSRFHLTRRARMHGVTPVNLDAPGPGQCMGAAGVSWLPSEPGAGRRGRNRHAENEERP